MNGMMKRLLLRALAMLALATVAVPAMGQELIGLTRAIGVAERTLSARAIEGELETDRGRLVYEIDLVRGQLLHRALIDARSGRLVSVVKPQAENWVRGWFDKDRLRQGGRATPLADHLAALERHSHGEVKMVDFKVREGRGVYEIELATAAGIGRVRIDSSTGRRIELAYDD